jgi:Homing endonuclease associated repeat/ROS/MUCR transcriptional regulator protein
MPAVDDEAPVACRICGAERHLLTKHLRAQHGLEPAEYHRKYPAAPVASDWVAWGISHVHRVDGQGRLYWTRDRIIRAMQNDAVRRGRPPISSEWKHAARARPGHGTVKKAFGSWGRALEAAGLPTGTRHKERHKLCNRGHPLRGANLRVYRDGRHRCVTCAREYERKRGPANNRRRRDLSAAKRDGR